MPLSTKSIQIVKATASVVAEHSESITTEMYQILFKKFPQTKELFKDADSEQHKKLAAAVSAYAANIDNLSVLEKAIEKIVGSHVRTKVKPEHYPMVGASILEAIKKVLGDAATPEILEAWKEAFFFLAEVLIAKEEEAYSA